MSKVSSKTVLIPVAHGSESLETVTIANILRRAKLKVSLASIEPDLAIQATLDIRLIADCLLHEVIDEPFDLIVLPGGSKGAEALSSCPPLIERLKKQRDSRQWYAAICAAPAVVLAPHGLLEGRRATCYPALNDRLPQYVTEAVVVDGNCVTSAAPGTAIAFALKLVELLAGPGEAEQVATAALVEAV